MKRHLILDGSNLLHRSYWISKLRKNAVPVELLFLNSLKKLATQFPGYEPVCIWDSRQVRGVKNFRQSSKTKYKQNRDKSKNADVFSHEESVVSLSKLLGIKHLNPGVLEADDYIAWVTKNCNKSVVVSSDSDLIQLVNERCDVYNPVKDVLINVYNFQDITGCETVESFILFKCIVGDKSDNIPGVPGYGLKRARKLIEEGVDTLDESQQSIIRNNIELIDLKYGTLKHPEEIEIYQDTYNSVMETPVMNIDKFFKKCKALNYKSIIDSESVWRRVFDTNCNITDLATNLIKLLK